MRSSLSTRQGSSDILTGIDPSSRASTRGPVRGSVRRRSILDDNHANYDWLASFRVSIVAGLEGKSALKCRGGWGERGPWMPSSSFKAQVGANHGFPKATCFDFTRISRYRQASATATVPERRLFGGSRRLEMEA